MGVKVEQDDVIVSLFGGPTNLVGTLRFEEVDDIKRHDLRRRAEALMDGNVLVDLALSLGNGRWRLLGKNRAIIGGLEPTKLLVSQTVGPKKIDEGGMGWPGAWGGES